MTLFVKEAIKEGPIQTLETVLMVMNGIERALVDVHDGEVKIEFNDAEVSEGKIKKTIEECGFHITH
ncbi:heavy-metal-associated domain-containing protein [Niallia endozanthoxylica]|nr:heavy-metal-associated domain-containing protein [Niallia endozanthoxylica]